jgi:hypothetical protein
MAMAWWVQCGGGEEEHPDAWEAYLPLIDAQLCLLKPLQ